MDGHLWTIHSLAPIVCTLFRSVHNSPHTHTLPPPGCPPLYIRIYVNPTPPPPPNPFIGGTTTYFLQIRMKKVTTPVGIVTNPHCIHSHTPAVPW